ncbi:MAG: hypothetical protein DI535_06795 [Citrobacter freundii]|nr:MAG: hypothetical protein DI535_06795 [Citrobacter freundii]
MKRQARLLKRVTIVFTFCIAILITYCIRHSGEQIADGFASKKIIAPGNSAVVPEGGNIDDSQQTITTESDLSQHNLPAATSPLVSVCLFVKKLRHR